MRERRKGETRKACATRKKNMMATSSVRGILLENWWTLLPALLPDADTHRGGRYQIKIMETRSSVRKTWLVDLIPHQNYYINSSGLYLWVRLCAPTVSLCLGLLQTSIAHPKDLIVLVVVVPIPPIHHKLLVVYLTRSIVFPSINNCDFLSHMCDI